MIYVYDTKWYSFEEKDLGILMRKVGEEFWDSLKSIMMGGEV